MLRKSCVSIFSAMLVTLLRLLIFVTAGVSKFLGCYISIIGQSGYVEYEICNVGKAVFRTAVLPQGL